MGIWILVALKLFFSTTPCTTSVINIFNAASELSRLFPSYQLETLENHDQLVRFTGTEANTLLAHMALGSVYPLESAQPSGFTLWYSSEQVAHDQAVDGYLKTIFDHFSNPYPDSQSFEFQLFEFEDSVEDLLTHVEKSNSLPVTVEVVREIHDPSDSAGTAFVLVAANKHPGPGFTGTQEERLQAASPALSLSSLICPTIPENAAIVTSSFPVHSAWTGHNRTAHLKSIYLPSSRPNRRYILADALPLDELATYAEESESKYEIPDFKPQFVNRETRKLYNAFKGARVLHQSNTDDPICLIEAPPWGCGAFGGNLVVKALCMMLAASTVSKVSIHLFIPKDKEKDAVILNDLLRLGLTPVEMLKIYQASQQQHGKSRNW